MENKKYRVWIGTNSVRTSRGIYTLQIDLDTENAEIVSTIQAYNSGALAIDRNHQKLYAASEGMVFKGKASGGLTSYRIIEDGILQEMGYAYSGGQRPCCLDISDNGDALFAANFFGGSLGIFDLREDGSISERHVIVEDPKPMWMHAIHAVAALDGGGLIAVLSVTRSALVLYDACSGEEVASYAFAEHAFPRSLAVKDDVIYAMLQDPGDIYVLKVNGADLQCKQTIRMLPEPPDFYGTSALRLSPDGRFLFAGARRTNTIAIFAVAKDGTLTQTGHLNLPGETPRDFGISSDGKLLVVAMQASDEVLVYRMDEKSGALRQLGESISIPSPAAVVID